MRIVVCGAIAFSLLCAFQTDGAAIDQMRRRLAELKATTAVAGSLQIEEHETTEGIQIVRRASADFECNPSRLQVILPAADLTGSFGEEKPSQDPREG